MKKIRYYSLDKLHNKAPNADFYLIIGQRGNGKTVGVLKHFLNEYKRTKKRFCYIRRWDEDIKRYRSELLFTGYLADYVREIFGEGFEIKYDNHKYYLINANGTKVDCIGYVLSLSAAAHTKSVSYERVGYLLYDEFIQMSGERQLPDELLKFDNTLSTIIRGENAKDGVKIYLCANTVSKFSPYFIRFGIEINKVNQGDIFIQKFPVDEDSKQFLTIALEYCEYNKEVSETINKYTNSEMIKKGSWEIPPTDSIPSAPNEVVNEKLLFTIYEDQANVIIGCFLRRSKWFSMELEPNTKLYYRKPHIREFLVLRTIERKSSYFHLSIEKSLNYHTYNDINIMLNDIKENTEIDFDHELYMGRVFSDNMFTADYFYNSWLKFGRVSARGLL